MKDLQGKDKFKKHNIDIKKYQLEEPMDIKEDYANKWDVSAQYFYINGDYLWMAEKLTDYKTIIEFGCGTGYSTLALVEKGFKVLAVDKNKDCLVKAKKLLDSKGINDNLVTFIKGDITDEYFRERLATLYKFDVAICWNIGSYWSKEMLEHYIPYMYNYGLTIQQIQEDKESSYSELITWEICKFAKNMNVPVNIVDRSEGIINEKNDVYYFELKDEFGYSEIMYNNLTTRSISDGGCILRTKGTANKKNIIDINLVSIFIK